MACLAIVLTTAIVANAGDIDLKKHPGYVDIEKFKIPDYAEEITEVDLGPELLQSLAGTEIEGDKDLTMLLEGLTSIRVRSFDVKPEDSEKIRTEMEKFEQDLQKDQWTSIIRTKDAGELTNISFKFKDGNMAGLIVMSVEPDEVALVNVVGNINLGQILAGLGATDFSALDSLQKTLEQYQEE
jgi:hypothetical protein